MVLPTKGSVFVSVANRDKRAMIFPVKRLAELGFDRPRDRGHRRDAASAPASTRVVVKHRGRRQGARPQRSARRRPHRDGEVDLVLNTPMGSGPRADGYEIRTASVTHGVPCITTLSGILAAIQGIEALRANGVGVRSLQEYHADLDQRKRAPQRQHGRRSDHEQRSSTAVATPVQGAREGPLRAQCEVLAYRKIGELPLADVRRPGDGRAHPARPVRVRRGRGERHDPAAPVLHLPVSQHGPWAGTVEIVFDVVGAGDRWLADPHKHDVVDLVGPLGTARSRCPRSRDLPARRRRVRAAPLLYLARSCSSRGLRVDMVSAPRPRTGSSTRSRPSGCRPARSSRPRTAVLGTQGRVTDVMPEMLETGSHRRRLRLRADADAPRPSPAAASADPLPGRVEEHMACGTGVCWTCVLPVERKGGCATCARAPRGRCSTARRSRGTPSARPSWAGCRAMTDDPVATGTGRSAGDRPREPPRARRGRARRRPAGRPRRPAAAQPDRHRQRLLRRAARRSTASSTSAGSAPSS
jgi:dihydroorotate dehydrogenase electron transfer subunit